MQDNMIARLQNATLYDNDGEKIGIVSQVYVDDRTEQPTFVTVNTGLFGMNETFIPVHEVTETQDGLQVPYDKKSSRMRPMWTPMAT